MPRSRSDTLGVLRGSMNISEPPPLRSSQARSETGSVCSSRELLVAQRAEDDVGRHQLGQRGRVGRRVGVALGEHLVAGQVEQQVALGGDLGRLRRLRAQRQRNGQRPAQPARRVSLFIGMVGSESEGPSVPGRRSVASVGRWRSCCTSTFLSRRELPMEEMADAGEHDHRQRLRPRPVERGRRAAPRRRPRRGSPACRPAPAASAASASTGRPAPAAAASHHRAAARAACDAT